MTDDELHDYWIDGWSVARIAIKARVTIGTIAGRIRRLRKREGLARWPKRFYVRAKGTGKPHPAKRAGSVTLPPLDSLR